MIYIYNMVNIITWAILAMWFDKWWIALFCVITILVRKNINTEKEDGK